MQLVGCVDGIEISFDFYPPNFYRAIIPKRLNGRYIVQLKAIDEAGNEASTADVYMYIDFQQMTFKTLGDKFKFNIDDNDLGYVEIKNIYNSRELDNEFNFKEVYSQYSYRELMLI